MKNFFRLKENGSNIRTEIMAGFTTFITMSYILAVNPGILGDAGMDRGAVFTATALAAALSTLFMGVAANLPFALAPGMGLNAFFAYTVVLGMGHSWQFALCAVFVEGVIFIILSFFGIRKAIIDSIPLSIRRAIAAGIGLFIALIGLVNAGIVVKGVPILDLGALTSPSLLLTFGGLVLITVLNKLKVKADILIGMAAVTAGAVIVSLLPGTDAMISLPEKWTIAPSLMPVWNGFANFDWSTLLSWDFLLVLFTFLLIDMFDTVGTLVGVATEAGLMDEKGNIPRVRQALLADAIGTTIGAALGTSTVTTYVESASGVAEGGKTGLTAVTTGVLFALSLLIAPLFLMVPAAATSAALLFVGYLMVRSISNIKSVDVTDAIPVFLTVIMMPLTYSIANGLMFGILSWVLIRVFTGRIKEIPIATWVTFSLFLVKAVNMVFQA